MASAPDNASNEKSGSIIPEFEDLKICVRTIKEQNPEQGIAKVASDFSLGPRKHIYTPYLRNSRGSSMKP